MLANFVERTLLYAIEEFRVIKPAFDLTVDGHARLGNRIRLLYGGSLVKDGCAARKLTNIVRLIRVDRWLV